MSDLYRDLDIAKLFRGDAAFAIPVLPWAEIRLSRMGKCPAILMAGRAFTRTLKQQNALVGGEATV